MDPPTTAVPASPQHPSSTQATDPVSSGVILQAVGDLRKKEDAVVETAAPGSTEATNPVSSDAVERLLAAHRKEKGENPLAGEVLTDVELFPITQLDTGHLLCRVLVVEEQGALQVPGAEKIEIRGKVQYPGKEGKCEVESWDKGKDDRDDKSGVKVEKEDGREESWDKRERENGQGEKGHRKNEEKKTEAGRDDNGEGYQKHVRFAECLAVTQRPDDICCTINSPLQLELYYDSQKDSVQAVSKHEAEIQIEPITPEDESREPGETRILERFDYRPVGPGAWRFSSTDGLRSLQIVVFPRRHSFALVKLKTLSATAGAKRDAPPEDLTQEAAEMEPVASNEIIKRLDSLAELGEGQMLHVMNNEAKEYSLFRMGLMGKTRSAQVFQARHSDFPDKMVVVKAFMYANRYSAVDRGKLWKAEYSIHRRLKSDFIVELFGGDARLEALIMDNIDARDLGSRHWCDAKGNKHFLGTRAHAVRVLADISQALLHLRHKGVLHNDIKPSNILFSEQRGAILIDFGLATVDGSLPSTGGTPWYVPREYLTGGRRAAPADVWALGIVVAYLLGHVPLPDSERQVRSWPIRDIARDRGRREPLLPPTPAQGRMARWLGVVDAVRERLLGSEDDLLAALVARMLMDENDRMTAEELAAATPHITAVDKIG
ncbi:hypothetical protein RB597_006117 [Gaeumannomyces tritici]